MRIGTNMYINIYMPVPMLYNLHMYINIYLPIHIIIYLFFPPPSKSPVLSFFAVQYYEHTIFV